MSAAALYLCTILPPVETGEVVLPAATVVLARRPGDSGSGEIDLGTVAAGRRYRIPVRVENRTGRTITPDHVRSGCGCLQVVGPARPIPPGGIGTAALFLTVGRFDERVFAHLQIGQAGRARHVAVVAFVLPAVTVVPDSLKISQKAETVLLQFDAGPTVDFRGVTVTAAGSGRTGGGAIKDLTVVRAEARTIVVRCRLKPGSAVRSDVLSQRFVLRRGDRAVGDVLLPTNVEGRVVVRPSCLRFIPTATIDDASGTSRGIVTARVHIVGLSDDRTRGLRRPGAVRVTAAGSDSTALDADVKELQSGAVLITLSAPAAALRKSLEAGDGRVRLGFDLDSPSVPICPD